MSRIAERLPGGIRDDSDQALMNLHAGRVSGVVGEDHHPFVNGNVLMQ
jgi:hypothetical protein